MAAGTAIRHVVAATTVVVTSRLAWVMVRSARFMGGQSDQLADRSTLLEWGAPLKWEPNTGEVADERSSKWNGYGPAELGARGQDVSTPGP